MRLGTALRERLYLSPLRGLVRRAGMGRALELVGAVRSLSFKIRFRICREERVVARITDWTVQFLISSPFEMKQVGTLGGEKKVLRRLIQEARAGDVVYDIGTNIGLYTVFLAKAVGERGCVIGFEPELRSYRRCEENLRLNALTNVRLFDRALGSEEKEHYLVVDDQLGSGVHHVLRSKDGSAGSRLQPIKVVNGDRFITEQALPMPNIIKVDVEGMEMEVLLGLSQTLWRPECRLVCCEVHFAILEQLGQKDAPRRILELLDASGFKRKDWVDSSHVVASKCLRNV